ncbi:MAG: tRNA-specific adenosine deaminase [Alphaproteobacteria bacterium CG11_big_fil_rev_8_21_14_0_20_39_49]|nr:MAG: tRNA-specific adenosine deaminase [Alphaproteobacteria bacterium CG11_big_fil_rev_8_21_14_0_20_39_49]
MKNKFMQRSIELSIEMMRKNAGGPFGAVIVKDGQIIAEGWNQVTSSNDPTAHAEITAIRKACAKLDDFSLKGCEIYTSCEPCPMCLSAIYWSRLDTIYFANTKDDAKNIGFDDSHIYEQIPLPTNKRAIPTFQIMRDDAQKAFNE